MVGEMNLLLLFLWLVVMGEILSSDDYSYFSKSYCDYCYILFD